MRAQAGTVIFAHLMLPHAPHILGENCEITDHPFTDPYDLALDYESDVLAAKARTEHYRRYFQQVHCINKRIRVLLDKMKVSGLLRDATIVITGDHGSRISMSHFAETMSKRDLIDNYGALFSIHAPSVEPLYDLRFVSLQRLFTEFLAPRRIKRGDDGQKHSVVVNTLEGSSVELEMPIFGEGP
jgi:arylsulfatase A-like enzyme